MGFTINEVEWDVKELGKTAVGFSLYVSLKPTCVMCNVRAYPAGTMPPGRVTVSPLCTDITL